MNSALGGYLTKLSPIIFFFFFFFFGGGGANSVQIW